MQSNGVIAGCEVGYFTSPEPLGIVLVTFTGVDKRAYCVVARYKGWDSEMPVVFQMDYLKIIRTPDQMCKHDNGFSHYQAGMDILWLCNNRCGFSLSFNPDTGMSFRERDVGKLLPELKPSKF